MADKVDPRTGEAVTVNYGWVKPTVGASVDAWGGYINTDLDGIDSTVHGIQASVPAASSTAPAMDGTAAVGTGTTFARADHVHPVDTSRYAATNPSGFQTAAQVTASLGSYLPLSGGAMAGAVTLFSGSSVGNGSTDAYFNFNTGSTAHFSAFAGQVAGTNRWNINLTGVPAETGSGNFGSDFNIIRCADNGSQLGSALSIQRSSGVTTIANLSAPQAMGDNRIINGNFAVNQRAYVTNTALAAAAYGHDRWKAGASGCTYTYASALPDTTITIAAGTLTQIIEAGMIEGGVYTLSWTGTAQARVYQGSPTGSYAASPIVTASLTAGTNTIVEFNTGTVVRVKLEIGTVATPYNRQSLAKSLADCQRYYQKIGGAVAFDVSLQGSASGVGVGLACTIGFLAMRAAPTAAAVGTWTQTNISGGIVLNPGVSSLGLRAASTAAGSVVAATVDATTYLTLNAEL